MGDAGLLLVGWDPQINSYFSTTEIVYHALRRRPTYCGIIDARWKATGLEGIALLSAHGIHGERKRPWRYEDSTGSQHVQDWINGRDGKAALILLEVCNPYDKEISSTASVVIHARTSFNANMVRSGRGIEWRMYVPPFGYLDTSRQRRHALRELTDSRKNA